MFIFLLVNTPILWMIGWRTSNAIRLSGLVCTSTKNNEEMSQSAEEVKFATKQKNNKKLSIKMAAKNKGRAIPQNFII